MTEGAAPFGGDKHLILPEPAEAEAEADQQRQWRPNDVDDRYREHEQGGEEACAEGRATPRESWPEREAPRHGGHLRGRYAKALERKGAVLVG